METLDIVSAPAVRLNGAAEILQIVLASDSYGYEVTRNIINDAVNAHAG